MLHQGLGGSMRRREFVGLLGGTLVALPGVLRAQPGRKIRLLPTFGMPLMRRKSRLITRH